MANEHEIIQGVYAAKNDREKADALIRAYIPFIRAEAGKHLARPCTEQDDAYSIAMMGFYEAILGYEKGRGAFLPYAALLIRSRLIDFDRKEARHQGQLSLYEQNSQEDTRSLVETLADQTDAYEDLAVRDATRQEIQELAEVMREFGVDFSDVAENTPRQARTLAACGAAIRYAGENKALLEQLLQTKKLPLTQLVAGSGVERKTLERHRNYLVAMLLIQTNGYEIIRGHLKKILKGKEAAK